MSPHDYCHSIQIHPSVNTVPVCIKILCNFFADNHLAPVFKMKALHLALVLGLLCLVQSAPRPRLGRSMLQNFAMDRVLKDKGFVRSLVNCVLDRGPCDGHGRQLRLMAPEILRGQCPGCSRTVHNQIRKVISHVQRHFPQEWSDLTSRFLQYPSQHFQRVIGYRQRVQQQ